MWEIVKLADVSNIVDSLHQTPRYSECGFCMVRVTDIKEGYLDLSNTLKVEEGIYKEFTKKYAPRKGDILMTRVGTYGVCSYVNEEEKFCLGQNTLVIVPRQDPKYLYYSLISPRTKSNIEKVVAGSTQKTISLKSIKELELLYPPLPEQRAIAAILSALDDKIEINNQINKKLEEIAQTLFRRWFVDFEFPDENGNPYKSSGGEMVESELGLIPKGWRIGILDNIVDSNRMMCKRVDIKSGSRYVGLEHIPRQELIINESGLIDDVTSDKLYFKEKQVLFGKIRPYFHKVSIAPWDGYCSSDALVLSEKEESDFSFFVLTVFSNEFVKYATFVSQGTKMPRAEWNILKKYKIVIPDKRNALAFNSIVKNFIDDMIVRKRTNGILKKVRDFVLPKLISGEIQTLSEEII